LTRLYVSHKQVLHQYFETRERELGVAGIEQIIRYAAILLDISDERQEDFDELLLERSPKGTFWLHFAVRPSGNRRKVRLIQT